MFSDKLILMFSGMLENIVESEKIETTLKQLDPAFDIKNNLNIGELINHFKKNNRLYDLFNIFFIKTNILNYSISRTFLKEMEKEGFYYNHNTKCIEILDKQKRKLLNWGVLKNKERAYVSLARFKLEKPDFDEEEIYKQFYNFIAQKVYYYNGRIWNIKKGNITAGFYLGDKINFSLDCAIDVLLNHILFNSQLNYSANLSIKISLTNDFIFYTDETKNIYGEAVKILNILEDFLIENTIVITEKTFLQLNEHKKKLFKLYAKLDKLKLYKFVYSIGSE